MEQQQNINKEEVKEIKWGGILNEFLWSCAGVNKKVLRQCPTDYAKYAGSGGTILFTALMAMISGGYAMFFVFDSVEIAIAFGVFWGMLIFNLDRFIVNTMYSDGLPTISRGELRSGLPRIIMAIFLGIVISTPLEMKIFEDRINSQLVKDNIRRTNETRTEAELGNKPLIDRRDLLEGERNSITSRLSKANLELKEEGEGSALSGKKGHGPIYKDKLEHRDAIKKELEDWDKAHKLELDNITNQILENQKKIGADIANGNKENGFCIRYEAFANIKEENPSLRMVSIIIMLLFIIIETTPTFFKMMMSSGEYDDKLREEMHKARVMADKGISDINDHINTEIRISTEKNRNRLEAEIKANKDVLDRIALAQAELLQVAIDAWREEELAKIKANPSDYIRTNMSESNQVSRNSSSTNTMTPNLEQTEIEQPGTEPINSKQSEVEQSSLESTDSELYDSEFNDIDSTSTDQTDPESTTSEQTDLDNDSNSRTL